MTDRIIAVNSNCYHGYSIEEAIAGIRAAGFHYIELTATKGWTEHVFPDQSFQRLLEVKDKLDEAGLIPFAMSGHTNLMDTARIPDFVKNIRLAHFFGARYIVSSVGEAHLKDNAVASNAVVAEHIRGFLPYLEKYDMILVLEVHGGHRILGSGADPDGPAVPCAADGSGNIKLRERCPTDRRHIRFPPFLPSD